MKAVYTWKAEGRASTQGERKPPLSRQGFVPTAQWSDLAIKKVPSASA